MCSAAGIVGVQRLECSMRYLIEFDSQKLERDETLPLVHDRMTECEYAEKISFAIFKAAENFSYINVFASKQNLKYASDKLGRFQKFLFFLIFAIYFAVNDDQFFIYLVSEHQVHFAECWETPSVFWHEKFSIEVKRAQLFDRFYTFCSF